MGFGLPIPSISSVNVPLHIKRTILQKKVFGLKKWQQNQFFLVLFHRTSLQSRSREQVVLCILRPFYCQVVFQIEFYHKTSSNSLYLISIVLLLERGIVFLGSLRLNSVHTTSRVRILLQREKILCSILDIQ